jgi:flagellar protein FlaI
MNKEIPEEYLKVFNKLNEKLAGIQNQQERYNYISTVIKGIIPSATDEKINDIIKATESFDYLDKYLNNQDIEDIMINNTNNIFVYASQIGNMKVPERVESKIELDNLITKFKMYATTATSNNKIFDVHLPNGSRVNIVESPVGGDITIRNFRKNALSIIDLVNLGELSFQMAARLWLYIDGLKIRPANILIGGMPASGKTTLLNSLFSFFRPESRIVSIEETYELNTETQENCVRLETNSEISLKTLVSNSLRMRPDTIVIGEVRGAEANDMMTAMNIGKIVMSTIHASTSRDLVTRLENSPMNVDKNIIPLIDALIIISQIREKNTYQRKITQVTEISGVETQVLLSDVYTYDYKTHQGSDILPSITYRDILAKLSGYSPSEILSEELRRTKILEQLNKLNIRDFKGINEFCKDYYENPAAAISRIGMSNIGTLQ